MGYLQFPAAKDIYLELNGRKIATVQSYSAHTSRSSRLIEAFGQEEPVGAVPGRVEHRLELKRVRALPGVDQPEFYGCADFNLVIVSPGRRVVYTGCQWTDIDESAAVGGNVLEEVQVVAAGRTEL